MSTVTLADLREAVQQFRTASEGSSADTEHAAAVDLATTAEEIAHNVESMMKRMLLTTWNTPGQLSLVRNECVALRGTNPPSGTLRARIEWDIEDVTSPEKAARTMWRYVLESPGPIVELLDPHTGEQHEVDLFEEEDLSPHD
ncbi:hypothetical protein [Actinopolyspora halophila]|uniref:hypothetical protein n=1 Tax=Actinopolyspora halophila TaxID=1850 RepID=UPI0003726714|nr:hypothetical protein [Actinopolyspora halophila]